MSDAYGSWGSETGEGATSAFAWYMAALDQEERAAEIYAGFVRCASKLAPGKRDSSEALGGAAGGLGSR